MTSPRTHYQILGVTPDAGEKEIKRAYHRLARKIHPDKATSPEEARRLESEFAPISRAYNVLKDRQKRKEYDEQLGRGVAPANTEVPEAESAPAGVSPAAAVKTSSAAQAMQRRDSESNLIARSGVGRKAFARGMQLCNSGEYGKAVEYFEAAIKNDETEAVYFARLGKTLMQARRSFTRAREMVLRAIEIDPYNPEYRLILGEICEMAGSQSLAIQAYKEVLKWDSDNQRALRKLAELEKQDQSLLSRLLSRFRK